MKSLEVYNVEEAVVNAIDALVEARGVSRSEVIKALLRKSLALPQKSGARQDFSEFCGIWTAAEEKEFNEAVSDFERVDEGVWK